MIRKILGWALVIFLVFFVVKNPASAAHAVKGVGAGLLTAGNGIGAFLSAVTQ